MRIIVLVFALLFSTFLSATSLNKIVVFGDSLSDMGNLYEYMKHQLPLSPPYYEGRFTNGPVWVELLAELYYPTDHREHLLDYAFGGAGVSGEEGEDEEDDLFTLRREVDGYLLAHHDKADEKSLYIMWMGANNYLAIPDEVDKTITDVTWGINANLERLISKGAKHILVINLPDLGKTPAARDFDAVDTLTYLSTQHNEILERKVNQLQANYPEVQLIYFNVNQMFADILNNPSQYGYTNTTDTCYEAMVNTPSSRSILNMVSSVRPRAGVQDACTGYVFFDPVHPAAPAHPIMVGRISKLLQELGIEFTE